MFPTFYREVSDSDLNKYANGEYVTPKHLRIIEEKFQGVAWEIELKETDKDTEKNKMKEEIAEKFKSLNLVLWSLCGESERKRKIVIIALPNKGTDDDLEEDKYIDPFLEDTYLEEIIVDRFLNQHRDKFGFSTIFFHNNEESDEIKDSDLVPKIKILKKKTFENLYQKITNESEVKEKIVNVGQKIADRIKSEAKNIYNEEEQLFGFSRKVTLEEYMKANNFDFSSNYEDPLFYLNLYYFLLSSYYRIAGNRSFKDSVIEILEKRKKTFSKEYDQDEVILEKTKEIVEKMEKDEEFQETREELFNKDGFSSILQYKQKIKNEEKLEENERENLNKLEKINKKNHEIANKYINELNDSILLEDGNKETKNEIDFKEIFTDGEEKLRKILHNEFSSLTQVNEEKEIEEILKRMNQMLSSEEELNLINELSKGNKAWSEGDLITLESIFETKEQEREKEEIEINEIAKRVEQNIIDNKSSLFITSLPTVVVGKNNLISILKKQGHKVVQIVNKKPQEEKVNCLFYRIFSEEKKLVGNFLGTSHSANRKMLNLNPIIHEALKNSDSIYLEVAPEIKKGALEEDWNNQFKEYIKSSKKNEQEKKNNNEEIKNEDKLKWEIFIEKAFPILFNEFKEQGATKETLDSITQLYQKGTLEKKASLIEMMISELRINKGEIAIKEGPYMFFEKPEELGIEDILIRHAKINKKKLGGLENDDPTREELIEVFEENYEANNLPEPNEVKNFLQIKINEYKELFDRWIEPNEEVFFKLENEFDETFNYEKKMAERNEKMAEKIDGILKKGEEMPFFAVGTAHLPGIIEILKKKGYKFERI